MKRSIKRSVLQTIWIISILIILSCLFLCACSKKTVDTETPPNEDLIEKFLDKQTITKENHSPVTESFDSEPSNIHELDFESKDVPYLIKIDFFPDNEVSILTEDDAYSAILQCFDDLGLDTDEISYEFHEKQELFDYQNLYKFFGYYNGLRVNQFELQVVSIDGVLAYISGTGGSLGNYDANMHISREEAENIAKQYMSEAGLLEDGLICWSKDEPEIYCMCEEDDTVSEIITLLEVGFDYELEEWPLYSVKVDVNTGDAYFIDNVLE